MSVVVDGVEKRYGDLVALAGVGLEVSEGELLVVVGPSGCGKSTLLRCIAGLEAVDAGTVAIRGRDVTHARPAARNVSMVFQSYALFPHLTAGENVGFGLVVRETPKDEVRRRVADAVELVGIGHLVDRRPYQLSGGERQRVALARALVRDPDAYLLDEPLSNLDAGTRVEMRTELRRLHRQVGATMSHVTHDQVEALTLADRVAVMDAGAIRQVGAPAEVYDRPSDRVVAAFLGTPRMNFLSADAARPFLEVPASLEVGIRPEHVRLDGNVARRVELVEVAGGDAYVHLGGDLVARVASDARPAEGDEVRLGIRRKDVHFFELATGKRVEP